ncbi:hypothetical protein LHT10_10105 [Lactococcus lactis]|uniref:hypothetical protein n=1 Tax=Lactococcus lactis TaxID=1358 RepID=UPI001F254B8A|nr:hypothetical protein [Lactococcus lactis]MCG1001488.1 hypothetical protein [Lactococcus lactis]
MKNQLLLEDPKQEHEIIIAEIENIHGLKNGSILPTKLSKVKLHVKRNKGKYIAGAIVTAVAIGVAIMIKNQHDKISDLKDDYDDLETDYFRVVDAFIREKNKNGGWPIDWD